MLREARENYIEPRLCIMRNIVAAVLSCACRLLACNALDSSEWWCIVSLSLQERGIVLCSFPRRRENLVLRIFADAC